MMIRTTLTCLAVMASAAILGQRPAPAPEPAYRSVPIGPGRTLSFYCAGTGGPTVILEIGWGGDARDWDAVIARLSPERRVCAYDRAGILKSSAGPLPRDARAIADDLEKGLRAARIAGPYVVVGHSAGGLYARMFAARHRRDVIGLVLVDPSVEYQTARFAAAFGLRSGGIEPMLALAAECVASAEGHPVPPTPGRKPCLVPPSPDSAARWRARMNELQLLFGPTSDQVAKAADLGAMPLIVLTGGWTYGGAAQLLWRRLHGEVARHSTRGVARLVPDSGHMMPKDKPDAIAAAVREVVAMARGG